MQSKNSKIEEHFLLIKQKRFIAGRRSLLSMKSFFCVAKTKSRMFEKYHFLKAISDEQEMLTDTQNWQNSCRLCMSAVLNLVPDGLLKWCSWRAICYRCHATSERITLNRFTWPLVSVSHWTLSRSTISSPESRSDLRVKFEGPWTSELGSCQRRFLSFLQFPQSFPTTLCTKSSAWLVAAANLQVNLRFTPQFLFFSVSDFPVGYFAALARFCIFFLCCRFLSNSIFFPPPQNAAQSGNRNSGTPSVGNHHCHHPRGGVFLGDPGPLWQLSFPH